MKRTKRMKSKLPDDSRRLVSAALPDDVTSRLSSGMFTSRTEEWGTPQYVFDALNEEFHFTLDVCATPENTKVAHRFITKKENGLN